MAKLKKPLLPPSGFNPSVFGKAGTDLPNAQTVTNAAAVLTGQEPTSKTSRKTKERKEKKEKKPAIQDKSNRVGITALIEPDLLKKVKMHALDKGISMSDICNIALTDFLKNNR